MSRRKDSSSEWPPVPLIKTRARAGAATAWLRKPPEQFFRSSYGTQEPNTDEAASIIEKAASGLKDTSDEADKVAFAGTARLC